MVEARSGKSSDSCCAGEPSVSCRVTRRINEQSELLLKDQVYNLVGPVRRNRPSFAVGRFADADTFLASVLPNQNEHTTTRDVGWLWSIRRAHLICLSRKNCGRLVAHQYLCYNYPQTPWNTIRKSSKRSTCFAARGL